MVDRVVRLEARDVHGHMDFSVEFNSSVTVIYGRNGDGKTTMLHILANLLSRSFDRLAYLNFSNIKLTTSTMGELIVDRKTVRADSGTQITVRLNGDMIGHFD